MTAVVVVFIVAGLLSVRWIFGEAWRDMESKCDTWPGPDAWPDELWRPR